jgi:hypothetical protein
MGWAGGSSLFDDLIDSLLEHNIEYQKRVDIYLNMINAFENEDCDTLQECFGRDSAYDEAFRLIHEDDEDYKILWEEE